MATAVGLDEPSYMECTVCHEHFTLPKLLPCGHLLCRRCLISWLKSQPEAHCPLCRSAIVDPKERKDSSLEDIADGFPTDLAMAALVEADRLLSKQNVCCVCVNVAAAYMCLNCGDMLCSPCANAHGKLSATKDHKVENLTSLTVEKLAANRPATCAVHDDKISEVYCPTHGMTICLLCATADHRQCLGVMKLETRTEEARVVLAELEVTLSAGETELERAISQLDQHLRVIDTHTQAAVAEIEAMGERLKSAVDAWSSRRKELALSTCADVKKQVQDGKTLLLQRQGRLISHKHVTHRVQGFSTHGSFGDMTTMMKKGVHDLDLSATLPTGVNVFSTVVLTIDPQAVSRIEQELSQLGQLHATPVAGAFQELRKEVKHRLDSSVDLDHDNQPVKPSDNGDHTKPLPDRQFSSSQPMATGVAKDFTTKSGMKVMVYKTDITKLPVDAIANAANEHLAHGGGVAYAIAKAAGFSLESEGQDYIQRNGPLKVREVVATTGGSLPCQKVLHAVGPRWSDYKDKAQCQEHLADTVYNCLHKADSMQLASLAIPSISSAIFGVPKDVCARSYLSAIQSFDRQCGDGTCLRQIHFVDVSEDMINVIQQTFTQHWNTDVQPSMARKSSEEKRSQPTSAQEAQQSSGSVTVSPAASTGGIAGESLHHLPATGNSFQAEQDPRIPVLKIFPGSQKGEAEYQFQFCGLDLILLFRQGTVAGAKTEAVVLWQEVGSVGRDKNFQQLANSLNQSAWKTVMSLTSEWSIQCVNAGSQILICPLVSPYAALGEETVQSFVERSISEADMRGKRSVTIPTFLPTSRGSKECNKELADFATGVYTAVRNYTSRPRRFVREIHVIHQDLQVIRSMSECVQEKAATDMSMVDNNPRERSQSARREQAVTCVICHEAVTNPKSLTCGHTFCTHCIGQWLTQASKCPTCNKIQGVLTGKQPSDGRMEMQHSPSDVPGNQGCGSLTIKYDFPAGRQTDEHPNPGHRYRPETRNAYLPNTPEGRKVLMLLKTAFDRRLVFTVGQSSTTGHTGIIWNDIHHKTSPFGGSSNYGYPDPDYLIRVEGELADKGVTDADLTDKQKDFIQNPEKYIKRSYRDFSHCFKESESSETVV